MRFLILLSFLFFATFQVKADNWALLVAGSNGYMNYRHQADVCHAYQLLHKLGIPDSRIVTMMYDDIANNTENPFPGTIVNLPNGSNVYHNVLKDYTGDDVNPKNFLNILSGNATAMKGIGSGKVIASTKKDKVFVYFSDHGATNLIAFPSDYLYADDLVATLKKMESRKQYKELVFYLEACESGSMFNGLLPSNIEIYTTTAANPFQSSYACYWDDAREAYLADCYSINWMSNTEQSNVNSETLETQFKDIAAETNTSQVCQYGQQSIAKEVLSSFFKEHKSQQAVLGVVGDLSAPRLPVNQRDVDIQVLINKLRAATDPKTKAIIKNKLKDIYEKRALEDKLFAGLGVLLVGPNYVADLGLESMFEQNTASSQCTSQRVTQDFDCFKRSLRGIESVCGKLDHYGLKYAQQLSRMCNYGVGADAVIRAAVDICSV